MDKRTFLKNAGLMGLAAPLSLGYIKSAVAAVADLNPASLAGDEDFWRKIRGDYTLKPDYINLENGYYCFMPEQLVERQIEHLRRVNYEGSYYMRNSRVDTKKHVAGKLGEIVGCTADEIAITRNATESLDLIIGGLHWNAGDEAIMAEQDYGTMVRHFDYVANRFGVVNRVVSVPNHPKDDDEMVDLYASAINDRTRLLMVSHMINITGQVLPVRKICNMAHARGVEVLVDGAHAYGHIDFRMSDLDCDYYGSSLHKWLSAPLGSGLLYVRKEKIPSIWPLLAGGETDADDIGRISHIGTDPVHVDLGILDAIEYQNAIGMKRKEARLKFLQEYWASRLRGVPNVVINTPADMDRHGGIGNVGIEGYDPVELADTLFRDYGIFTVGIKRPGVLGLRITPNLYTTTSELDALVSAITELSAA